LLAWQSYSSEASPRAALPLARLNAVVAEIALDAVDPLGNAPYRSSPPDLNAERGASYSHLIATARHHVQQALRLSGEVSAKGWPDAEPLIGIARLALARYERIIRRPSDRVGSIEAVTHSAQKMGDWSLLAQAYTTLGFEFAQGGHRDASLRCHYLALDALAYTSTPVLGAWARRAILRDQEFHLE
jgi:hypothetical protein